MADRSQKAAKRTEGDGAGNPAVETFLDEVREGCTQAFEQRRMIKSFDEFIEDVFRNPRRYVRNSARYLLDMFDYFGTRDVRGLGTTLPRYNLFDDPTREGIGRVYGQELVQQEIYLALRNFVEKGRPDKILLLHGPNGSSKTSLIDAIVGGLEHYSAQREGALYTFNWVFSESIDKASLGFTRLPEEDRPDTFAYLDPEEISSKLPSDLRDNPLFLIPREERVRLLRKALAQNGEQPSVPRHLIDGNLSPKSRSIYDCLMNAYQGDWRKVVRHVQVERFFISKRYRIGAVSIEPQRNVDASSRPVNFDRSATLPTVLQNANIFEALGDLVDGNRGVIEYSDFFKRPIETIKYLLTTSEKGTVNLPQYMAYLDVVLMGTSNEKNLSIFKHDPHFSSFKGRFELIRVPYLLEFSKEARIYENHLENIAREKPVAPHTAEVAALWAVLTRLRRPRKANYEDPSFGSLAERLTPLDKAMLYDRAEAPEDWKEADRRTLLANIDRIRTEFDDAEEEFEGLLDAAYEGRRGASPREILTTVSDAASFDEYRSLSPLAVFKALTKLCRESGLYDFLRLTPRGGYYDPEHFIELVEDLYQTWILDEVQDSIALVEEREYTRLFLDYFIHVKAYGRNEKVRNRNTGEMEPPDENLMEEVESVIGLSESPDTFRKDLITRIAAYSIENPGSPIPYRELFKDIFKALKKNFYSERLDRIETVMTDTLKFGSSEFRSLDRSARVRVTRTLARMKVRYGYDLDSAKEVIAYALKHLED